MPESLQNMPTGLLTQELREVLLALGADRTDRDLARRADLLEQEVPQEDGMVTRETVECSHGPSCGSLHPDHHGWDCPLSDPHGDCLRVLADPSPNPLLEGARRAILRDYGVEVTDA